MDFFLAFLAFPHILSFPRLVTFYCPHMNISSFRSVALGFVSIAFLFVLLISLQSSPAVAPIHTAQAAKVTKAEACFKNPTVESFMYHYVRAPGTDPKGGLVDRLSIGPADFLRQMTQFADAQKQGKIAILFPSELANDMKTDCYPNKKIVVLIADDGWSDGYTQILPVVQKLGVKFSFAIISGKTGLGNNRIAGFLTQNEIKKIIASKWIEILSHSVDHGDLKIANNAKTKSEICDSKQSLQTLFGVKITTFVYPSGHYNKFSSAYLKACGYTLAFTTKPAVSTVATLKTPYFLPRIRVAG